MDFSDVKTVSDLITLNNRKTDDEKLINMIATEALGHGPDIAQGIALELVKTLLEYHDCVVEQLMDEKDPNAVAWILDRDKLNNVYDLLSQVS